MDHVSLIRIFTAFAMMGAEWVMWVLVGLSILSIAVGIDLWLYHRAMRDDVGRLADDVNRLLRDADVDGAVLRLQRSPSPAALIALAGIYEAPRGGEACEHVMQSALARTKPKLERNLTLLATIGNNAPFIGLFGTVIGIIQAFDALKPPAAGHLAGAAAAAAAAAAQAATGRVMGTIAEALVATAIGLLVAIPAVGTYNFFQRRVKLLLGSVESLAQVVLAYARGREQHGPHGLDELVTLLREERDEMRTERRMILVDADETHDVRAGGLEPLPLEAAN